MRRCFFSFQSHNISVLMQTVLQLLCETFMIKGLRTDYDLIVRFEQAS